MHCPLCQQSFEPERSEALPFCSNRCRDIDLGRWLNEEYALPHEREDEEEEEPT